MNINLRDFKMNNLESTGQDHSFKIFPDQRLDLDFPWQVWIVGWIALFKACSWLSCDPNVAESVGVALSYKYMILMIPLVVMVLGVWNLRKWAVWGLIVIAIAELLFFVVYPASLKSFSLESSTSILPLLLSLAVFTINGPVSDVFILLFAPFLL